MTNYLEVSLWIAAIGLPLALALRLLRLRLDRNHNWQAFLIRLWRPCFRRLRQKQGNGVN